MTCPCVFPLVDYRYDKEGILYFPDDNDEPVDVKIEPIVEKGKKYMMVLYRKPPKGAAVKEYKINGHLAYAGCAEVVGGKLKCDKKSLFYVLHPNYTGNMEWTQFHELRK